MNIEKSNIKELAGDVLLEYKIIPEKVTVIQDNGLKTLWKFTTGGQILCLKRLKHEIGKAVFSVNAQIHVYNSGGKVPKIILNSKGSPITQHNGELFVLYQWLEGRDLDFSNSVDLAFAVEGLAEFHIASKGYLPPADAKISSKLGKWHSQYESMKKRITEWKEKAKLMSQQSVYGTYLKWSDSIIEIADTAIDRLQKSSYDTLTSIKPEQSPLCHQDYGKGNALLLGEELYVLDLDGVTYDLPIRDLRKIIGKQAQNNKQWNSEKINFVLEHYQKVNELTAEEISLLKIDLMFPHWYFGTVKNLFQKNKLLNDSEIERIAKLEKSKLAILDKFF